MQRTLELHYDKIIIGADLDALHFSYANNIPIFFIRKVTLPPYTIEGANDNKYYDRLLFLLSLRNLVPASDKILSIDLEDNIAIKISLKTGFNIRVTYNHLYISDDYNVTGLPLPDKQKKYSLVLDYIDVLSGHGHKFDSIKTKAKFVSKIVFYTSKRFFYKQEDKKDCVTISIVNDSDLEKSENSDIMVRIITARVMKENGITGRWDKTNKRFKPIKLRSNSREIYPITKTKYSTLPSNISILQERPEITLEEVKIYGK